MVREYEAGQGRSGRIYGGQEQRGETTLLTYGGYVFWGGGWR